MINNNIISRFLTSSDPVGHLSFCHPLVSVVLRPSVVRRKFSYWKKEYYTLRSHSWFLLKEWYIANKNVFALVTVLHYNNTVWRQNILNTSVCWCVCWWNSILNKTRHDLRILLNARCWKLAWFPNMEADVNCIMSVYTCIQHFSSTFFKSK